MKKTGSKKSRDTVPLKLEYVPDGEADKKVHEDDGHGEQEEHKHRSRQPT
jgi:hypothetical protein